MAHPWGVNFILVSTYIQINTFKDFHLCVQKQNLVLKTYVGIGNEGLKLIGKFVHITLLIHFHLVDKQHFI
jgi:hypothetical protein